MLLIMQTPSHKYNPDLKNQFSEYLALIPDAHPLSVLRAQLDFIRNTLAMLSEEKSLFAYAPGKWTIREMLQHIIDTERIFSYRALCVARGEKQQLPGFDENAYAANANGNDRKFSTICEEMITLRQSTIHLIESFDVVMWNRTGNANGKEVSTDIMARLIAGHFAHHQNILKERYNVETREA